MCSIYETELTIERLRELFPKAPDTWLDKTKRFKEEKKYDSLYPRSIVPVVTLQERAYNFVSQMWGIRPGWKPTQVLTNTRSEKVFDGYARDAFKYRRCLLPANAFYEFVTVKGYTRKIPMRFQMTDEKPFCFAGIWESSIVDGVKIPTCSILTTEPNSLIREVHNRMPVILGEHNYELYLTTSPEGVHTLNHLLEPSPDDMLKGALIE